MCLFVPPNANVTKLSSIEGHGEVREGHGGREVGRGSWQPLKLAFVMLIIKFMFGRPTAVAVAVVAVAIWMHAACVY